MTSPQQAYSTQYTSSTALPNNPTSIQPPQSSLAPTPLTTSNSAMTPQQVAANQANLNKNKIHPISRTHEFDYSQQQFDYGNPDRFLTQATPDAPPKHPLWSSFAFWMYKKQSIKQQQQIDIGALFANPTMLNSSSTPGRPGRSSEYQTYLDSFVKLGPLTTVEDFWNCYVYLKRPQHNLEYSYHCFRDDIEPTWEHPGNINGGKWSISLRRNYGPRLFEVILLSFIGNEYNLNEEICGVVLSIKKNEDIVSIWVKNSQDQTLIDRIRHIIKRYIYACYYAQPNSNASRDQPPPVVSTVDFKPHENALNKHHSTQGQNDGTPTSQTATVTTTTTAITQSNHTSNSNSSNNTGGLFERNQRSHQGHNKHNKGSTHLQFNTNQSGDDDFTIIKHDKYEKHDQSTSTTTTTAPTVHKNISNNPFAMLGE